MTLKNPRLLVAACGLVASVSGGLLPEAGILYSSQSSHASLTAAPATQPATEPHRAPGEQQTFVWGYSYAPELLPDLSWMTISPGTQYRLFDQDHKCIGIIAPTGEVKLLHYFPEICQPVSVEGVAHG